MSNQDIEYDERKLQIDYLSKNQKTIADLERERSIYVDPVAKRPVEMIQECNTRSSKSFNQVAIKNIHDCNKLNTLFFSKQNMQIIQNAIRRQIYENSNGEYLISEQDASHLYVVMRSIYLQESDNLSNNIRQQITKLNNLVLDWVVPKIMSNIKQELIYLKDVGKVPDPIPQPTNVNITGTKLTRQFQPFFKEPTKNKNLDEQFKAFPLT